MSERYYDYWLTMPLWRRVWCVIAYRLFMLLPLAGDGGRYQRFTLWLLEYGGAYAYREVIHPEIGIGAP